MISYRLEFYTNVCIFLILLTQISRFELKGTVAYILVEFVGSTSSEAALDLA
jgi:hypothetical protein